MSEQHHNDIINHTRLGAQRSDVINHTGHNARQNGDINHTRLTHNKIKFETCYTEENPEGYEITPLLAAQGLGNEHDKPEGGGQA